MNISDKTYLSPRTIYFVVINFEWPTLQLTTNHSQRLNSRKSLSTGCCEWLWSIATWANGTLNFSLLFF